MIKKYRGHYRAWRYLGADPLPAVWLAYGSAVPLPIRLALPLLIGFGFVRLMYLWGWM